MTHEQFIANMETAYGKYSNFWKLKTYEYVFEKYNESDLKYLERLILENHSVKWKTPPVISDIKDITEKDNQAVFLNEDKIGRGNKKYYAILEHRKTALIENNN